MKIYIGTNHCCDLNYTYDVIADELYDLGEIVEYVSEADIIVFPATCCGSLEIIKIVMNDILDVMKRKKKDSISFVSGCMTTHIKDIALRKILNRFLEENFDYIIPEDKAGDIINIITQKKIMPNGLGTCIAFDNTASLYISKGCANKCSFCKTNYIDMPLRSVEFDTIKKVINSFPKEINSVKLLGVNTA